MTVLADARLLVADRRSRRGQQGFILITGLAVWTLVGGVVMFALLGMTVAAAKLASAQAANAQEARAIEGALETAMVVVQTDQSEQLSVPADKTGGKCGAPLGRETGNLGVEDGLGNVVTVEAT